MTARSARDRAAMWLGGVSALSAIMGYAKGDLLFVQVSGIAMVVALGLGALAFAAGWLGHRLLTLAAGAGFLFAAVLQLALMTQGNGGFLRGNGSTFALWLGLGAGLLALALTPHTADADRLRRSTV